LNLFKLLLKIDVFIDLRVERSDDCSSKGNIVFPLRTKTHFSVIHVIRKQTGIDESIIPLVLFDYFGHKTFSEVIYHILLVDNGKYFGN